MQLSRILVFALILSGCSVGQPARVDLAYEGIDATPAPYAQEKRAAELAAQQTAQRAVEQASDSAVAQDQYREIIVHANANPHRDQYYSFDMLNLRQTLALQKLLREHGHYGGDLDGKYGRQTKAAMRHFRQQHLTNETGFPTLEEWALLLAQNVQR